MLIDTHCHLDAEQFDADREAVLARARRNGVESIVIPAIGASNFDRVAALCAHDAGCAYALGIHPMYVDHARPGDLDLLRARIERDRDDPGLVAVGEIGLDHFVPGLDRARQEYFLVEQLKIAREFELPVLLHVRRSQDALLKQLRRFRPPGGIAHAFNASPQQARAFLELGFALGFGGAMTFTRALRIRRLASELPPEAHVLETDAPDIAPSWIAPGRNTPGELAAIAEVFASLRGLTPDEAARQTGLNACRALPRLARRIDRARGAVVEEPGPSS
ncbi:MAG: TatD family hydrolase [Burkholderiaceae bacterium]|nr:TatD family hydrolase [Burkholderiaceae bacterium]